MALPTFPYSPMPAGITRMANWASDVQRYDSGDSQGITAFQKPLYKYQIPIKVMNETRQASLWQFLVNDRRGPTRPFLLKDPYDYRINSAMAVRSGIATGTLYLRDVNSYAVRVDSTTITSLFSVLSGYVLVGSNFTYEQDTGIITLVTKASTDIWGVRSAEYFRKVRMTEEYSEQLTIWNIFGTNIQLEELP